MSKLLIRPAAAADVRLQRRYYVDKKNPETARRWVPAVRATYRFLLKNPGMGEPYETRIPELEGLRCWPVDGFSNHYVYYRSIGADLEIVRVLGGFRNVQSLL